MLTQLHCPKLIFWDFDGVIKDSIEVKANAFAQLFCHYDPDVVERVNIHHETHGGMSRFEKIPLYLGWAGVAAMPDVVTEYCQRFANLVRQAVMDAPWVPGVEKFLRTNPYGQEFILVTATPQDEIEEILATLNLRACFTAVYGAPKSKRDAIRETMASRQVAPQNCLVIGDAKADWDAAQSNQVPFLLRRHDANGQVFKHYTGNSVEDFTCLLID